MKFFSKFIKSKINKDIQQNSVDNFQSEGNTNQQRFDKYMYYIKNGIADSNGKIYKGIKIPIYFKKIIVEYLNYNEVIQNIEFGNCTKENSLFSAIYQEISRFVDTKYNKYLFREICEEEETLYEDFTIICNKPICVNINELDILLNPWTGERTIQNLISINDNNVFDGIRYSRNVENCYLYPMDIVVCGGGNHSQFSARYKNQGNTIISEIHNYSNLYSKIKFNGENYIQKDNGEVIPLEYDKELIFYSGIIFELGRCILNNNHHSLDVTKKLF